MNYNFYKNKKNQNIYLKIGECINKTNEQDNEEMIYYIPIEHGMFGNERYVRTKTEFEEKFYLVKETDVWPTEELYTKFS